MKKLFCFTLALLLAISCLSACDLSEKATNMLEDNSDSPVKVEEMMNYLSEKLIDDAKSLIHSETTSENPDTYLEQMSDYLDGRKVVSMELEGINVKVTAGTSDNGTQEEIFYKATLTDNTVVYINAVYLSNDAGTGFTSFNLVLGVV